MNDDLKSLVEYRLDEARESIEEAVLLLEGGKITRCFKPGLLCDVLRNPGVAGNKELGASKHSGVIRMFHEHYVQDGTFDQEIARSLSVAFDLRNKSDYREFTTPSSEQAQDTLEAAKKFVAEAELVIEIP